MNVWRFGALAIVAAAFPAHSSELRVEPTLLEVNAPGAAATLTLRSDQDSSVTVQTRVMRWSQVDGREKLEPALDVVASPPAATLSPHGDYTVRVIRLSKEPVRGEESYRLLVDQLPDLRGGATSAVRLLIRQSIPVFFRGRQFDGPRIDWALHRNGRKLALTATNSGDEHLRIASLKLREASGKALSFGPGLAGYSLGRSSMTWVFANAPNDFGAGAPVAMTAQTDKGPLSAIAH